jgi:hypothetical protein
VLGHADTKITEIYAERDLGLAMRIMREIGRPRCERVDPCDFNSSAAAVNVALG